MLLYRIMPEVVETVKEKEPSLMETVKGKGTKSSIEVNQG
jgi:hypothetical protein